MLKFINVNDHPSNRNKMVFYYREAHLADYFESLLIENNIGYEKQIDHEGDQTIYFGVRKSDYKIAQNLNFLTHGKHRKPFIRDPFFKYLLIIVTVGAIVLAIIGAVVSN